MFNLARGTLLGFLLFSNFAAPLHAEDYKSTEAKTSNELRKAVKSPAKQVGEILIKECRAIAKVMVKTFLMSV